MYTCIAGDNEGISFNELLQCIRNNENYECFTYKGFKTYIYNCLEKSDFIEIDGRCYIRV